MGPSPLPANVLTKLDEIYRRRWETLLSVDDTVSTVYAQLKTKQLLDDTYIIFTSDNGFHMGKHNNYTTKIILLLSPSLSLSLSLFLAHFFISETLNTLK